MAGGWVGGGGRGGQGGWRVEVGEEGEFESKN